MGGEVGEGKQKEGPSGWQSFVSGSRKEDSLSDTPVEEDGQPTAIFASLSQQIFTPVSDAQVFIDKTKGYRLS